MTAELVDIKTGEVLSSRIPVSAVQVGERFRKDLGDLSDLKASIAEHGVLSPITLLPGNRLLCGGRRLEACRQLGMSVIPFHLASTQDDALSRIKAERDENTCRKDMTTEELVDLGLELERLERPKALERQEQGRKQGRVNRWSGLGSTEPKPDTREAVPRTSEVVGNALGMSSDTYKRARHVVQSARGDNDAAPEIQEVAQEALKQMNDGQKSVRAAYDTVRAARKEAHAETGHMQRIAADDESRLDKIATLAREGHTSAQIANRLGHHVRYVRRLARDNDIDIPADRVTRQRFDSDRALSSAAGTVSAAVYSLQQINPLDLNPEEAQEWVDSLTESITALRKALNPIKESLRV